MPTPDDGDVLVGARAIKNYLNGLLAPGVKPFADHQVYFMLEQGHLPSSKLGQKIVATKSAIRQQVTGQ